MVVTRFMGEIEIVRSSDFEGNRAVVTSSNDVVIRHGDKVLT